jgi:uncharacterized membrane protein YgcG
MWATTLQITLMIALPASLVWIILRPARRGRARYPSGDGSYNLVDFSSQDGSNRHQSGADFSGPSGDSASVGDAASDGGGGGGSSD